MADLAITDLYKKFNATTAVNSINFNVADGEFVTLLGPSGCGKSTTLAAIAGLDHPDTGKIVSGDRVFFDSATGVALPPELRNCGLVFQAYALWPHMTVDQNVAFPLKLRKVSSQDRKRRVAEVLELVEMTKFAARFPHQLSGGQQQRVALARTLVYEPAILLLDEPLSNLDAKLRERARIWLSELHKKVRRTTIYVTHDQVEALTLSDRIIIMNGGEIVQIGTPEQVYNAPADPFVADFIGTSSFLSGELKATDAKTGQGKVQLASGKIISASVCRSKEIGSNVTVAIRPERLQLAHSDKAPKGEEGSMILAEVKARSFLGSRYQYELAVEGDLIKTESVDRIAEDSVWMWVPSSGCIVFPAVR